MASGFTFGGDIVHQILELFIRQEEFGIRGGTAHRINAKDAPVPHAEGPEVLADLGQVVYRALVDAGDDIER